MSHKERLLSPNSEKSRKQATQIRIDEELFLDIKSISEMELRTLNAQIEYFLIQGVDEYREGRKHLFEQKLEAAQ